VVYGVEWRRRVKSRELQQRQQILAVKPLESAGQRLVAMASDTGREKRLMNALDLEVILCTTAIFVRRAVSLHFEVFSAVKCQHRSASPRMMQ
jgi:hypothetical protein